MLAGALRPSATMRSYRPDNAPDEATQPLRQAHWSP